MSKKSSKGNRKGLFTEGLPEEFLRALINELPEGIFFKDAGNRFVLANRALADHMGVESAEVLIGRTDRDFYPKELADEYLADERGVLESGRRLVEKIEPKEVRGARRMIMVTKVPVAGRDGETIGLVGVSRDVTEVKRTEEALRNERNLLRSLIEILPVSMYTKDAAGRKTMANPIDVRTSGHSSEAEVLGKTDYDLYPKEIAERFFADDRSVLDSGIAISEREEYYVNAEGKKRWLLTSKVPLRDSEGAIAGLVGVGLDITERKEAFEKTQARLRHLTVLSEIDRAITSSFDLRLTLSIVLDHVIREMAIDAADVLLLNPSSQTLDFFVGKGFRTGLIEQTRLRMGDGNAGIVAMERRAVHIPDASDAAKAIMVGEGFVGYYGLPLVAKGQIKAVLEVYRREPLRPDDEWIGFLNTLAEQAAIAVDNVTLFDSLQRSNSELLLAYDATIEGWSHALDLRDKETEGHTRRVTDMTVRLGRELGLSEVELVQVRWGALLHDIGKLGVPDAILLKASPLTDEEWVIMKRHPTLAYEMLYPIRYLHGALDIPYRHHEKWDGSGYPVGLKGDQIPLSAKIFSIVDVWDALRSDRPYRPSWPAAKVLDYIRSLSGSHFDPDVVSKCLSSRVFRDVVDTG